MVGDTFGLNRINIVTGLPNHEYHGGYKEYISSTTLKKYTNGAMAFKHSIDNPQQIVPAHLTFGSLWHDLISSHHPDGEKIENLYAIVDYPDYMLNKGKVYGQTSQAYVDGFARLQAEHQGKTIIFTEQFERAQTMVSGIFKPTWKHPSLKAFRAFFEKGTPEVSYFVRDFIDGVHMKFRPDLDGESFFIDYKTTSDSLSEFPNAIAKYGYDVSAAMYYEGKQEANRELFDGEKDIKMYWLVQEVNPPHDWALFSAEYIMPEGINKFFELLSIHKNCIDTNEYGGLAALSTDKHGIFFPKLPSYRKTFNPLISQL